MNPVEMYVVYRDPSDYPGLYVVRRWTVIAGKEARDVAPLIVTGSIVAAREAIPPGLHCLGRYRDDDPKILEVWI